MSSHWGENISVVFAIISVYVVGREVTDSKSESDGIRHFSKNPKSVAYLKSDCNGFKIFVLVQLYNYFHK